MVQSFWAMVGCRWLWLTPPLLSIGSLIIQTLILMVVLWRGFALYSAGFAVLALEIGGWRSGAFGHVFILSGFGSRVAGSSSLCLGPCSSWPGFWGVVGYRAVP